MSFFLRKGCGAEFFGIVVLVITGLVLAGPLHAQFLSDGNSPQVELRLPQQVTLAAGGEVAFELVVAISPSLYVMSHEPEDPDAIAMAIVLADQQLSLQVDYPEGRRLSMSDPKRVYGGVQRMPAVLRAEAGARPGERRVTVTLDYQGCTDKLCYAPATLEATMVVTVLPPGGQSPGVVGEVDESPLAAQRDEAASGEFEDDEAGQWAARLQSASNQGIAVLLGLFVLLGLALNLTPCVFPLLPMTIGFFASQGHTHVRRTLPLALAYVLGICLTFAVLGVVVALFGGQFGDFLSSAWGVGIVSGILLLMAVSLLGGYEIRLPLGFLSRFQGQAGLAGALLMGGAVGLVATPCVGPILAAVVIFVAGVISGMSASGIGMPVQVAVGAGLFFAMGFGLGLPYLALGIFSGQIKRVPRGGGWLMWVKRLLALPVLAMVLYFLQPYLGRMTYMVLLAALLLSGGVYLGLLEGWGRYPWSRRFIAVRIIVAMLLAAAATGIVVREVLPDDRVATLTWQEFSPDALSAARGEGRPAIVYYTADWCQYCRVMEAGLFRQWRVHEAVSGVRLLKVDMTRPLAAGSAARELMESSRIAGPPALLFYGGDGVLVDRITGTPGLQRLLRAVERAKVAPSSDPG